MHGNSKRAGETGMSNMYEVGKGVVDADGYAVNVVLWDGETPFDADGH